MSDIDAAVRELWDREALKELKARYFRFLDTRDRDGLASVFTEDAVFEVPRHDVVIRGRDAIADEILEATDGARTVHHGHMPELELTGPDTARGIWAMADIVEWPRDESGNRVGISGSGHYEDEYMRVSGEWKIARSVLVRLRVDDLSN